jgi:hypothetical protein
MENKEKKVETREVPEKLREKIKAKEEARRKLVNEFLGVAFKRANLNRQERELLEKIDNNAQALDSAIENAYKKMRLDNEKEYQWSYTKDGNFIGIKKPEPPKQEEKK